MDELTPPAAPDPGQHGRIVLQAIAIWVVGHLLLLLVLGLPGYVACLNGTRWLFAFTGCGGNFGFVAAVIGGFQVLYGPLLAFGIYVSRSGLDGPTRSRAVPQGILIGVGLVLLLHTVLCFGLPMTDG